MEVEQGRLGVLSSTDAYLFHFQIKPSARNRGKLFSVDDPGTVHDEELDLVYLWLGREAAAGAREAVRAQVRGETSYSGAG